MPQLSGSFSCRLTRNHSPIIRVSRAQSSCSQLRAKENKLFTGNSGSGGLQSPTHHKGKEHGESRWGSPAETLTSKIRSAAQR